MNTELDYLQIWNNARSSRIERKRDFLHTEDSKCFLNLLNNQNYKSKIYKGANKIHKLNKGDYFGYTFASLWSDDKQVSLKHCQEYKNPVLIILEEGSYKALENNTLENNTLREKEIILHPCRLIVRNRYEIENPFEGNKNIVVLEVDIDEYVYDVL